LLPTALLALIALMVANLFPEDAPLPQVPDIPPVYLSADASSPGHTAAPGEAAFTARLVERAAEYLRARRLDVTAAPSGGYYVAPASPVPASTARFGAPPAPGRVVKLTVGLSSSAFPAASGSETRLGGDGDASWRLAYQVQRNLVGGMREVLGYETYDRGAREHGALRSLGAGSPVPESNSPWVAAYPLFSTNRFEALLSEDPGSIEVLAVALSNAVADYLDPTGGTPRRTAQAGWSRATGWQPVEPKSVYQAEDSPQVAFTFDGGASSVPTPAILKALRDAGVRATMFMTADFVEANPDLVVQMARDGHEFGNHSSTHPDMTTISDWEIVSELDRLEAAVVALTGRSTRPWFRPPFGAIDDRVLRTVAAEGYYAIMWTADSADWRTDIDSATVASRLLRYSEPGAIMIEHLGSPQSAEVLADVLRVLAARGVRVGPLSEVVGTP
jgi:peptidoglycan/xylan/chitin deacetylase (PgdA/CDA1 family)